MTKNQAPEKKPAEKKAEGIEVLELDRPSAWQGQHSGGDSKKLLVLLALGAVIVLGLILLPDPVPRPVDLDGTLPAPVAATTIPDREQVSVGVIGADTFPLQFESSLDGYRSLAGPAYNSGAWWMIGNAPGQPAILTSLDGVAWSFVANFPTDDGRFVEVHDLISSEDALIAVGPEGTRDVSGDFVEQIEVWRSPDGLTWIPEVVAAGLTFTNSRVVANGHNLVVTASDAIGHDRLYHSSSFTLWEEISITFSTDEGIVLAPEGGLMVSTAQGAVLTSAFGVNWSRTQAIDRGFYTQWRDRVVGTYTQSGQPLMRVIGEDDIEVIELPIALDGCRIHGGLTGLLAICPSPSGSAFNLFLSEDGLTWIRSQSAIFTDALTYEGGTDRGFFVSAAGIDGTLVVARATFPD